MNSREEAVKAIKDEGLLPEFMALFERTPEDYFSEYAYLEPEVWAHALGDVRAYRKASKVRNKPTKRRKP